MSRQVMVVLGRFSPLLEQVSVVEDINAFLPSVTLKEVPGCGAKARERLGALGLSRLILGCGPPRGVPARLEGLLWAFVARLEDLCQGIDPAGLELERKIKSVSHEETFVRDISDREILASHLLALAEKVGGRLRRYGLAGRTMTLKLRHQDFRLVTSRQALPRPSDFTQEIYQAARSLLLAYGPEGPFRLIGWASPAWSRPAASRPGASTSRSRPRPGPCIRPRT